MPAIRKRLGAKRLRCAHELILAGVKKHNPPCGGFTELSHRYQQRQELSALRAVLGGLHPRSFEAKQASPHRQAAGRRQPRHAQAVGIQPATASLLASLLAEVFQADQVAVVTGNAKIGSAFSNLPFDHILFTGSIPVGRAIMRAASENLVPVTLGQASRPSSSSAGVHCAPPCVALPMANWPMPARPASRQTTP